MRHRVLCNSVVQNERENDDSKSRVASHRVDATHNRRRCVSIPRETISRERKREAPSGPFHPRIPLTRGHGTKERKEEKRGREKERERMERDVLIMVINDIGDRDGVVSFFPCEIDDPFVGHPKFMCGHRGTPGGRALFSSNKQVYTIAGGEL